MSLQTTLSRIEKDIEQGAKYKSAQRLRSLIKTYPDDLSLRNKLAELYNEAGFFDAAGLYWLLTEPNETYMQTAVDIYRQSVNNSAQQILADLALTGEEELQSDYAKRQIQQLEAEKIEQDKRAAVQSLNQATHQKKSAVNASIKLIVGLLLILSILGLFVLGVINGIVTLIQSFAQTAERVKFEAHGAQKAECTRST